MSAEQFKFLSLLEQGKIKQINETKWTDKLSEIKFKKMWLKIDDLIIPDTVIKLNTGIFFNSSIDSIKLSNNLQEIIFGKPFNQPLDKVIFPESIKSIEFEGKYSHSISDIKFPPYLVSLNLGPEFNLSLENVQFPETLKILKLGHHYNQSIDTIIFPQNLETLRLGKSFNDTMNNLPFNLLHLELNGLKSPLINLPYMLKSLTIYILDNEIEKMNGLIEQSKIPFDCELKKIVVNKYNWW